MRTAIIALAWAVTASAQSFPTVEVFKTASAAQKVSALQAIAAGRITMPANLLDQYLTIALADADARVREHGLAALSWFEARRAVSVAGAATSPELAHHEPTLRRLVVDDRDARVRGLALSALAYLTMTTPLQLADDVMRLVLERIQKEPDGLVRISAIGLLVNTPDPAATAALIQAIGDPLPGVRAKAIEVIGNRRVVTAIPRLVELLSTDADWFPRWHAARALGRLAPESRALLADIEARARREPDARVREEIAKTLATLRRDQHKRRRAPGT